MIERQTATTRSGADVVLMDSVSFLSYDDGGAIVVCASHGGVSSGQYALVRRPGLIFFNDAGVGKDDAGISALRVLAEQGVAAASVSSQSARIGDVLDHWNAGIVSHANGSAAGIMQGMTVQEAIDAWNARR